MDDFYKSANQIADANLRGAVMAFGDTLGKLRDRQDEIERKGLRDPLVTDELRRMNADLGDLKTDINGLFKKVNRPNFAVRSDTPSSIETKADREFRDWFLEKGVNAPFSDHGAGVHRKAYAAAFNKWTRSGEKALTPEEIKTLSVGSTPDGGFYVEPARSNRIIQKLFETSEMRPLANAMEISTSSVKFPVDRDEPGFEWVGEQSTRNATTAPQIGELEIPVHEVSCMPAATQNILDDSGINIEDWLNGKIADKFARAENNAFVLGNGTSRPKGFLTYPTAAVADTAGTRAFGTIEYIPTGVAGDWPAAGAGVLKTDVLLKMIYALKAGYRSGLRWAMTRTTLGNLRTFKDGQGNYIAGVTLTVNGLIDQVFSMPVSEFADMPEVAANSLSVALADWSRAYQIVDRGGMRQLRDPYTSKPLTLFYTTKRVGGAVIDTDAIKLLKFSVS